MADAVIENPILNSPYEEPSRHFAYSGNGITSEIVEQRRSSAYLVPIARPRRDPQLSLETDSERHDNEFINLVRRRIGQWRTGGWPHVTPTTRRLLEYWTAEDRERPLFFCQLEAVETAIYLTEAAPKLGEKAIADQLRAHALEHNPGLLRIAFKMATGSGKTVVMAMIVVWQTLNKVASPKDTRFSDAFLVVTPGITIRDRLRVLLPSDPNNYYQERDLVPIEYRIRLQRAKVKITNFHSFQLRDTSDAGRITKSILARGASNPFLETPDQMVERVCRGLGARGIVVMNDEAHHCYRPKPREADEELTPEEKQELERSERAARVWMDGLDAVKDRLGVKAVYDLSATPFFLRGSGYREGVLFPWVLSDFALIDAIESGIVKIPRVPVADDAKAADQPTYRDIWGRIRDKLPKKGRKATVLTGEPNLPPELQGALHSLYEHYCRAFEAWEAQRAVNGTVATPPVFIVVCNNTSVSKLVFDYIAGWEKEIDAETNVPVPGELPLFSNVEGDRWRERPYTILVDSEQLESGEAMSAEFKAVARHEIEEFKAEYRARYPGRDAEKLTNEDLLREVMNTVGKPGKLGEHVRCVVSVSMLTEGWDANTVTHILGVRAFGSQLLCEQVVGRGLRRRSYATNETGLLEPEYAEVYGVPFAFIPAAGADGPPPAPPPVTHVRAVPERAHLLITFPRVVGYRYELSGGSLHHRFGDDQRLELTTEDVPTETELAPAVGAAEIHTLDDLRRRRDQEVVFFLARRLVQRYFPDEPWLFPQLIRITRAWIHECVTLKGHAFPQMLLLHQRADDAVDRIYQAIVQADPGEQTLIAALAPYDPVGSTMDVDFDTIKPAYVTSERFCHVDHVVEDSTWEADLARTLESMNDVVVAYVKNQGLGFTIPYTIDGIERGYWPDFIVRLDDGRAHDDLLNLVVEVTGAKLRDKQAKVATARNLWVPAVNNLRELGRWAFVECTDPLDAERTIRSVIETKEPVTA